LAGWVVADAFPFSSSSNQNEMTIRTYLGKHL